MAADSEEISQDMDITDTVIMDIITDTITINNSKTKDSAIKVKASATKDSNNNTVVGLQYKVPTTKLLADFQATWSWTFPKTLTTTTT